jgi:hypothetical protein
MFVLSIVVSNILTVSVILQIRGFVSIPTSFLSDDLSYFPQFTSSFKPHRHHDLPIPPPPFSPYHTLPRITLPTLGDDNNGTNRSSSVGGSNHSSSSSFRTNSGTRSSSISNLVVFVMSRNDAFERRQIIRRTWAKNCDNVYFVVGSFCKIPPEFRASDDGGNPLCQVRRTTLDIQYASKTYDYLQTTIHPNQRQLHQEQATYQDILVMDAVDVYRHLPKKIKTAYTFVHHYLPSTVGWILKVDDDMFVRPRMFEKYIVLHERKKMLDPTRPTVLGTLEGGKPPPQSGKWAEVVQFPYYAKYPTFPLGSAGHLVSRPVATYISTYQDTLFDYQGEDVSLGIWLAAGRDPAVPSPPQGSVGPDVWFEKSSVMKTDGDCKEKSVFVLGHDFNESSLRQCQDYWDNQEVTKNRKKPRPPG